MKQDKEFFDLEVKDVQVMKGEKSVTLTWTFVNLQQDVINKIMESSCKIRKHYEEDLPIKYQLEISEIAKFSWLSYFDKSEILGIELYLSHGIVVGNILDNYNDWRELHESKIKPQYKFFANQVPSFVINGITFNTNNLSESFCDWYISSNLGVIMFEIGFKQMDDNSHEFSLKIIFDCLYQQESPDVLQRHISLFLNDESKKYLFPLPTTPPAPKELKVKIKAGRPESKEIAERNTKIYKELLRLTETRYEYDAKQILLTTFKNYFNSPNSETNRRNLDRIIQKMKGH